MKTFYKIYVDPVEKKLTQHKQKTYEGRLKSSCAAVMQREAVTVMPSYSSGGNIVVAWSLSL
jgi:hypothetical protein